MERGGGRVEDCLQDSYKVFGPKKAPVQALTNRKLVSDVLRVHNHFLDFQKVVKEGEKALQRLSRPPSVRESVSIPIPDPETFKE